MHVISFEELGEESSPIKNESDTYRLRFTSPGSFHYNCSIYTRMRGCIDVIDTHLKKKNKIVFRPLMGDPSYLLDKPVVDRSEHLETKIEPQVPGIVEEEKYEEKKENAGSKFAIETSAPMGEIEDDCEFIRKESRSPTSRRGTDLNQRLIEVLENEEDLRKSAQVDTDTPVIKPTYFQEMF